MLNCAAESRSAEPDSTRASGSALCAAHHMRGSSRLLQLLFLCDYRVDGARTVLDHIDALIQHSGHRMYLLSVLGDIPEAIDLERFDGIVIHYSLVISVDDYLSPHARERIRAYEGLKIVFIQDEYRFVDRTCDALRYLGVQLLFTCVPDEEMEKVYPAERLPGMHKVSVLTGYVPEALLRQRAPGYAERPIDVGYRARRLPAFYGELAQEKWRIAAKFADDAATYGLNCDISYREEDRLYGDSWEEFLKKCKAVLGVESGASVFDFTGEIERATAEYERRHPGASFEEIRERCFPGLDGQIRLNQISPRCFEAAALGTLMVLYEGEYSGVLVSGRHYVPLKKDHSNMKDVVASLMDENTWIDVTRAAYQEIALNPRYSYRHFGEQVGKAIIDRFVAIGRTVSARQFYSDEEFETVTQSHRIRVAWQQTQRARFGTWRWRVIAKCVDSVPPWLTSPLRMLWRAWRRYQLARLH